MSKTTHLTIEQLNTIKRKARSLTRGQDAFGSAEALWSAAIDLGFAPEQADEADRVLYASECRATRDYHARHLNDFDDL